jgi:dUTP pyrophosphatase
MKIKFAKVHEDAKIPSKREEDAGYDVYACFDEDYMIIEPHSCVFVPTGIATAFDNDYVALLRERGSTGSKQMALRCGVIDAGFRGEWKIAINNTSNERICIVKEGVHFFIEDGINYPYEKAIAQFILTDAYHAETEEVSYDELKEIKSKRGTGMLGSSGA